MSPIAVGYHFLFSNGSGTVLLEGGLTFPFDLSIRRRLESKLEMSIESLGAVGEGTTLVTGAIGGENEEEGVVSVWKVVTTRDRNLFTHLQSYLQSFSPF